MEKPKIIYASNRYVGFKCLEILISNNIYPIALLLPSIKKSSYTENMINLVPGVPIIRGLSFKSLDCIKQIKSMNPDYIISVHFPYIIPPEIVSIPKVGILNLHPAFLPFNKGWNTPSWAIMEGTPFGVTLHWIDEGIDTGDIAMQKEIKINTEDTADSLYKKAVEMETKLFKESIPQIIEKNLGRYPQKTKGTFHRKEDIEKIQRIEMSENNINLLKKLRALTTNKIEESAFFEIMNKKYFVRVEITSEE